MSGRAGARRSRRAGGRDCYLGVDVGGSSTRALVADGEGRSLGLGCALGGNHQQCGYDGLFEALRESIARACEAAGVSLERIAGAGFGIAGYDFPGDRAPHLEVISRLGLGCQLELENDAVNGLLAGTTSGIGVNISAGTSVNCRGRGPDGRQGRIVGNSTAFGEFGGGGEIAWKGLHMVNYAWMRRIPPTALTRIYLEAAGARDEMDLMEGLSAGLYHCLPPLALGVFKAAREGDDAAQQVLRWAGEELGWLAVAVIRQIGMEREAVEVVQSGGVFEGGGWICRPMEDVVLRHAPRASLRRLEGTPVAGALLLGMQAAGLDHRPLRRVVVDSAKRLAGA